MLIFLGAQCPEPSPQQTCQWESHQDRKRALHPGAGEGAAGRPPVTQAVPSEPRSPHRDARSAHPHPGANVPASQQGMPQSMGQAVRQIQACIKEVLAAPKRCEHEVLTVHVVQITCARGMAHEREIRVGTPGAVRGAVTPARARPTVFMTLMSQWGRARQRRASPFLPATTITSGGGHRATTLMVCARALFITPMPGLRQ